MNDCFALESPDTYGVADHPRQYRHGTSGWVCRTHVEPFGVITVEWDFVLSLEMNEPPEDSIESHTLSVLVLLSVK